MSKKKNKNQAKKVLSSFADLGNTGKSALSRLATTVKADAPTMILSKKDFGGTVKTDSIKLLGGNKMSNFAKRLIPFRAVDGAVHNKPAAAKLKHIAGKMGKAAVPKTRKSKGIIWLFLFFAAVAGSGYYAWNSIDGLGDKVVQMVDYKSWLNKTAGKTSTINIGNRAGKTSTINSYVKKTEVKSAKVKSKTVAIKKSKKSKNAVKGKITAAKKKQWKSNLAKLKKRSKADYQKASVKYRSSRK